MENESEALARGTSASAGVDDANYDRYEREIDLDSDSTHARVVRLVGNDRRVLELGPATGHMTRVLRDRGCAVVGIEVDPGMANLAARYCERVVVADLDILDLDAELGSDRFDVIVAADVLEHLKDPLSALRRLRNFLNVGGYFVASLPNVAHGSVRMALLQGHFDYQSVGLLDTTHLRFFTRESIGQLFDEAELAVAEIFHQELNMDASEVRFDAGHVPAGILEELAGDPEARTYQFVIKAVALDAPGLRELQRRMRALAHENAELREAVNTLSADREDELRRAHDETLHREELHREELHREELHREEELRIALIAAHDQMLRRDEEIDRLQEELGSVNRAREATEQTATRLRVRLERITNSPPARAYSVLGNLPGFKRLRAARTAGYDQAVRGAQGSNRTGS